MASTVIDEIRETVADLEAQCHNLGPLVDRSDWDGLDKLLSDMRRVRHALANAWHASAGERTPEFEEEIKTRVQRVLDYREYQLRRIEQYNEQTRERLQLISRWRAYSRSIAGRSQASPALFSDTR